MGNLHQPLRNAGNRNCHIAVGKTVQEIFGGHPPQCTEYETVYGGYENFLPDIVPGFDRGYHIQPCRNYGRVVRCGCNGRTPGIPDNHNILIYGCPGCRSCRNNKGITPIRGGTPCRCPQGRVCSLTHKHSTYGIGRHHVHIVQ